MIRNFAARRLYSTVYSTVKVQKGTSVRDLFYNPVFKSLFLTLVLGSAVVEATKNRKELDALRAAYEAKFGVLENAIERIRRREPVDMAAELRLANSLTRNKYNNVTDVHLDDQFEAFLKLAENDDMIPMGPLQDHVRDAGEIVPGQQPSVKSADFL